MPYKASGEYVMVKRNGVWVRLRKAKSPADAQKQARALNANVTDKEKTK